MLVASTETFPIRSDQDVVQVRQQVRSRAIEAGMSLVDQTKIVTAASEIARNTLSYGRGGSVTMESLIDGARRGVRLSFADEGPGIPDIERALTDHYSTGGGLGLGLSGARRLSNEFSIDSQPGAGTRVMIARWTLR